MQSLGGKRGLEAQGGFAVGRVLNGQMVDGTEPFEWDGELKGVGMRGIGRGCEKRVAFGTKAR